MFGNWLPAAGLTREHNFIFDEEFFDCNEQATRLCNRSGDLQWGSGSVARRLFAADVGDVAIYVEYSNQPLETEISISPDTFSFVTAIVRHEPYVPFGGVTRSTDWLQVAAPGGEHVTLVHSECVLVLTQLKKAALQKHPALLPEVADWFMHLPKRSVFVTSPWLAERFRADVHVVILSLLSGGGGTYRAAVDKAFVCGLVNGFNMEWLRQNTIATHRTTRARERSPLARKRLMESHEKATKCSRAASRKIGSQRFVELAFSSQVNVGPLSNSRVARLHNARWKLQDKALEEESIGDITAEEGFWDWSRFTTFPRLQFGELSSDTCLRSHRLWDWVW